MLRIRTAEHKAKKTGFLSLDTDATITDIKIYKFLVLINLR